MKWLVLLGCPAIFASTEGRSDGGLVAALFLPALGLAVSMAFAWGGYRLRKREKQPPPAYAEFLDPDPIEEVDAELDGGGR